MNAIEVIRLEKKIRAAEFSASALQDAREALETIKSSVDARRICQAMSETWQEEVLPLGRELLSAKKAGDRERGLELFAYVADLELVAEVEEAKGRERSKKLVSTYDYTVRRIRKAYERKNPAADPLDMTADPVARMQTLANLPYQELWELTGIRERYWGTISLPLLDGDSDAESVAKAQSKRLQRLTSFLRSGETQPYWLAQLLFIAHPNAGESARELVWQAKVGGKWISFRDGADVDGNAVELEPTAEVRLAHPVELGKTELSAWSEIASAEGWSYALKQLETPVFDEALADAVKNTPPLNERKAKAWLDAQGLTALWHHEHRQPHAVQHVLSTDDNKPWLRLHHDAIVARRTGSTPIRVKKVEVPRSKRRQSEAVRLLRDLAAHASAG